MRGVDGLLCLLTDRIDAEVMDAAGPGLKVISNHAVGFDNIDVAAATERGIPVGNTPGILTDATADMAFALMMAAGRRVVEAEKFLRAGKWKTWGPSMLLGIDFAGATLGIIGFGRIGQAVAKRATGFDMRILYYDPNASILDPRPARRFDRSGHTATGIRFRLGACAADARNRHLVNAEFLAKMKPNAVLVNTSRGGVLDQTALYETLERAPHLRRRPGCDRPRTAAAGQPTAQTGQLHHRAAYRQRQRAIARYDGISISEKFDRGSKRGALTALCQPGSVFLSNTDIELLRLLAERLERLSVDSLWARRASGLRGNIIKVLEEIDSDRKLSRSPKSIDRASIRGAASCGAGNPGYRRNHEKR